MTDSLFRTLLAALVTAVVALLATAACLVVFVHASVAAEPSDRSVELGRLRYEVVESQLLDSVQRGDARLVAGLPREALRVRHDQTFFAVFLGVTNDTAAPLPLATRIDLRDERGHTFAPIHLPAANPFAYDRREIGGRSRFPAARSVAGTDLAAGGSLLLYRIPARAYENDVLEIEIHDPLNTRAVAYLTV